METPDKHLAMSVGRNRAKVQVSHVTSAIVLKSSAALYSECD